jgi:hypothetical protein
VAMRSSETPRRCANASPPRAARLRRAHFRRRRRERPPSCAPGSAAARQRNSATSLEFGVPTLRMPVRT